MSENKIYRDREILTSAQEKGPFAVLLSFFRLSGPGWLQSAITLGGGSLIGALYLGMLGGTSMLWLQMVAIVIGVIMLSAISYVTLSTRKRPYAAINEHVNPVLGAAWLLATILANMIWIMPQFSLCYDALDKNLLAEGAWDFAKTKSVAPADADTDVEANAKSDLPKTPITDVGLLTQEDEGETGSDGTSASDSDSSDEATTDAKQNDVEEELEAAVKRLDFSDNRVKFWISLLIAVTALLIVTMSFNPGGISKLFDLLLKLIVGVIVICFVAVVYWLTTDNALNWNEILMGFIPNFNHWNEAAPSIQELLSNLDGGTRQYWEDQIIAKQRESMIGVTATAVGLNMTFLLPYSMLARGWDKPFRGLAKFDLITGMAIPYIVVTTCIVIASSHAFHGKADAKFLDSDPKVMTESVLFDSTSGIIEGRFKEANGEEALTTLLKDFKDKSKIVEDLSPKATDEEIASAKKSMNEAKAAKNLELAKFAISLGEDERRLMPTLVKPNAAQLAATLTPLLGENNEKYANLIFGIGAFAMGFSTIIILSLINGYAFAEMFGRYDNNYYRTFGAIAALICGVLWYVIWAGESRTYLGILASTFGAILLPIAYLSFFLLMNSSNLLGQEKPRGGRMAVWNLLMGIGVLGAIAQAVAAIQTKIGGSNGAYVLGGVGVFVLLAIVGFSAKPRADDEHYTSQIE